MVFVQSYFQSYVVKKLTQPTSQAREIKPTNVHDNYDDEVGWFPSLY